MFYILKIFLKKLYSGTNFCELQTFSCFFINHHPNSIAIRNFIFVKQRQISGNFNFCFCNLESFNKQQILSIQHETNFDHSCLGCLQASNIKHKQVPNNSINVQN